MEPPMDQPPRGTKRPLGGGDIHKASGTRRYSDYGAASYDFVDDDVEGGRGDTGFLDEDGTFVERAARGGTKEDAWLGTDDAPAAAATKRARKGLRKQEEDDRLVDDLVSSRAVFEIKKRMAGLLQPGETVPRALRRLKGLGGGTRGTGRMDEATRRAFDELTDAAAELVERGDLEAYSDDREAFERAAWVYEYRRRARARARASASAAPEQVQEEHKADQTAATTSQNYVDMFADDVGAGAETATDVDAGGHADNPDQPAALRDASGASAEEEAEEGTGVAGWDYVYDPASGYYYSGSTGYFYDPASGCYCSASTGTWFSYNDEVQCSDTGKEM